MNTLLPETNRGTLDYSRRAFINYLRGICIFLMLWGHCIQYCANNQFDFYEDIAFRTIYSFHMPLFMLISGYLFYYSLIKRSLSEILRHKVQSIGQPLVLCTAFIYYITIGISSVCKGSISALVDGKWIHSTGGLWFLWSVLTSSIVVSVSNKLAKNFWQEGVLLILGFAFVALLPDMTMNLYMYPFFVIGYLLGRKEPAIPKVTKTVIAVVLSALFPALLLMFQKKHYIYITGIVSSNRSFSETIKIDLFRWTIGIVGCVFAISVILVSFILFSKTKPGKWIIHRISILGKNSLAMYTMSVALLSYYLPIIVQYLDLRCFSSTDGMKLFLIYDLFFTPVLALGYAVAIHWFIKLLYKIHIGKYLFGR